MSFNKDHTEVRVRLVVKDSDLPKVEHHVVQLGSICEYNWDLAYSGVTEDELANWQEQDDDYEEDEE